jgi:hypothetical protein
MRHYTPPRDLLQRFLRLCISRATEFGPACVRRLGRSPARLIRGRTEPFVTIRTRLGALLTYEVGPAEHQSTDLEACCPVAVGSECRAGSLAPVRAHLGRRRSSGVGTPLRLVAVAALVSVSGCWWRGLLARGWPVGSCAAEGQHACSSRTSAGGSSVSERVWLLVMRKRLPVWWR